MPSETELEIAREDIAFSEWLKARRERLEALVEGGTRPDLIALARSAFQSGVRHGRASVK